MEAVGRAKALIKRIAWNTFVIKDILFGRMLYAKYRRTNPCGLGKFLSSHIKDLSFIPGRKSVPERFAELLDIINIRPINNSLYFYSIDCFKSIQSPNQY